MKNLFLALLFATVSTAALAQTLPGVPEGAALQHAAFTSCDTKEQVKEYVERGQNEEAMFEVNEKYGENACTNGMVFYLEGDDGENFDIKGEAWTFQHVLIVGVMAEHGPQPVPPTPQWTAYAPRPEHKPERSA